MKVLQSSLALLALVACGSGITGTNWTSTVMPSFVATTITSAGGTPSQFTYAATLSFGSDGKTLTVDTTTTAPAAAGSCATATNFTGTYTSAASTLTPNLTSVVSGMSGCQGAASAGNTTGTSALPTATANEYLAAANAFLSGPYKLSGSTLTITDASSTATAWTSK